MPWARLDDQYPDHPKLVEVGPIGMALHVAAICYSARYLTDGFVPASMIPRLISLDGLLYKCNGECNAVTFENVTRNLVQAGLFEVVDGGYRIHDYLEYNPTSSEIKAERDASNARVKRWRSEKRAKRTGNAVGNAVSNAHVTGAPSPYPYPINKTTSTGGEPAGFVVPPVSQEERIYCVITNHAAIPNDSITAVIESIAKVAHKTGLTGNALVEHLRPYWLEYHRRWPHSASTAWITQWAVAGAIPPEKKATPQAPRTNGKPAPQDTGEAIAQAIQELGHGR